MSRRLLVSLLAVLILLTACSAKGESNEKTPYERKILKASFTDGQGGTMDYYVIKTTYRSASPDPGAGLHMDAFRMVFDVDGASVVKEFEASGHPAAIYQGESKNYICCTVSPEASVVMAYDPGRIAEEEAVRVLHSIFQVPEDTAPVQPR